MDRDRLESLAERFEQKLAPNQAAALSFPSFKVDNIALWPKIIGPSINLGLEQ